MRSELVTQILITGILVPLSLGILDLLRGRRDKRHRFDERRLDIYSRFTTKIAEVLWAENSREADRRREEAWVLYETIALISTEEVIKAAVRVRFVVTNWLERMREAEVNGLDFSRISNSNFGNATTLRVFHTENTNSVYRELSQFTRLARKNMGLSELDLGEIESEIEKFYEW